MTENKRSTMKMKYILPVIAVFALAAVGLFGGGATSEAHGERGSHAADLNAPPSVSKIVDEAVYGGKHVVWMHAAYDGHWDKHFIQAGEVTKGDTLNWPDLNQLERTSGCLIDYRRSYATTAIYGARNGLVAANADVLKPAGGTNGDWGLSGTFTHTGTVHVYRATMGFRAGGPNGTFSCIMFEKYQFKVVDSRIAQQGKTMALILTGKFTPEQAQPPEPDIHAEVVFQHVKVLEATGYVVLDGATPEIRLRANTFDDGVVQIGMLIHPGDESVDGMFRLPDVMERCIGKDLQFGDNIVGELRKGITSAE